MKKSQVNEGNKLIAEFMVGNPYISKAGVYVNRKVFIVSGREYLTDRLEYHSSWDWLMPVVEKIEKIVMPENSLPEGNPEYKLSVRIEDTQCRIEGIFVRKSDTKISATLIAVVEFIEWHNQKFKK